MSTQGGPRQDGRATVEAMSVYSPGWRHGGRQHTGLDEDVVTLAVQAAQPLMTPDVRRIVIVSRAFSTLEPSASPVVIAALRADPQTDVRWVLGGGPAALDALVTATPATLVVGVDAGPEGAASAACRLGDRGLDVSVVAKRHVSLPTLVVEASGVVHNYDDARLERELGWSDTAIPPGATIVSGLDSRDARRLGGSESVNLPTRGAAGALTALASIASAAADTHLVAFDGASSTTARITGRCVVTQQIGRAVEVPGGEPGESAMKISLPAYARAFPSKIGLVASRCPVCGTLALPQRVLCIQCGHDGEMDEVSLVRRGTVHTHTTVRVPVPGLRTPYDLVIVEIDDGPVRLLAPVTGAAAGGVTIGQHGNLVLRIHAIRSGVADYGYSFMPDDAVSVVTAGEYEVAA